MIGSHWPSRSQGKYRSEPLRIAVAENIAYIIESHMKVLPEEYETLRAANNLAPVLEKWETKVIVLGDFNDEPGERSVIDHLRASKERERVIGATNDINRFKDQQPITGARTCLCLTPPGSSWRSKTRVPISRLAAVRRAAGKPLPGAGSTGRESRPDQRAWPDAGPGQRRYFARRDGNDQPPPALVRQKETYGRVRSPAGHGGAVATDTTPEMPKKWKPQPPTRWACFSWY